MKRTELEKYLGEYVLLKLFDNSDCYGELHKTGEEIFKDNPNLYIPHNYYFLTTNDSKECINCLFRCSHVKSLQ